MATVCSRHWLRLQAVHELQGKDWREYPFVVCPICLLSNSDICAEIKFHVCWYTALWKEYSLLVTFPNMHLPQRPSEDGASWGHAHLAAEAMDWWAAARRGSPAPSPPSAVCSCPPVHWIQDLCKDSVSWCSWIVWQNANPVSKQKIWQGGSVSS